MGTFRWIKTSSRKERSICCSAALTYMAEITAYFTTSPLARLHAQLIITLFGESPIFLWFQVYRWAHVHECMYALLHTSEVTSHLSLRCEVNQPSSSARPQPPIVTKSLSLGQSSCHVCDSQAPALSHWRTQITPLLSEFYQHNRQMLLVILIFLLVACLRYCSYAFLISFTPSHGEDKYCHPHCTAGIAAAQTYQAIHPGSYSESVGKPAIESISPASKFSKCLD